MQNKNIISVLFVGDVIGKPGRKTLKYFLPLLKEEFDIDFTIINGENLAAGYGITEKIKDEILKMGVDVITTGNHIWDKREGMELLKTVPELLRPANYKDDLPGKGYIIKSIGDGINMGVVNIQGRVFMPPIECPFDKVKNIIEDLKEKANIIFVDFHAEATSEKKAMGWFLDGEVSAIVGTHTHVQTADEEILSKGTAYISDVGMTGGFNSVIGMKIESALYRMLYGIGKRLEPSNERLKINGVVIDIDKNTGKAVNIVRINREIKNGDENT